MLNITKDFIINNAIYIEFPLKRSGKLTYMYGDDNNVNKLPDIDMMFGNYSLNNHHYASPYHFNYVLPSLDKLFKFGFKISDFKINEKIINNNKHDISYLTPLNDNKTFTVKSLTFPNLDPITGKYEILVGQHFGNNLLRNVTDYHYLYCLPHMVSIITNHGESNGKTFLILGDSQLIPDIPVIAYYYKNVIYVDNRNGIKWIDKIKEYDVNDIMIEIFEKNKQYHYNSIK